MKKLRRFSLCYDILMQYIFNCNLFIISFVIQTSILNLSNVYSFLISMLKMCVRIKILYIDVTMVGHIQTCQSVWSNHCFPIRLSIDEHIIFQFIKKWVSFGIGNLA